MASAFFAGGGWLFFSDLTLPFFCCTLEVVTLGEGADGSHTHREALLCGTEACICEAGGRFSSAPPGLCNGFFPSLFPFTSARRSHAFSVSMHTTAERHKREPARRVVCGFPERLGLRG
jgi:hypothetical protein